MASDLRTRMESAARLAPPPADDPLERLRSRRERKARRGRLAAATVSLILTAGAIGGAMLAFRSGTAAVNPPRRAAAGPAVDLTIGPGQFYFVSQVTTYAVDGTPGQQGTQRYATRTWYGTDDAGRVVVNSDGSLSDHSYDAGAFPNGTGDLTYLSTDPTLLLTQMTARMQPDGRSPEPFAEFTPGPGQDGHVTAGLVRSIGELLNDPNATPALKAALFQVASGLQGMSVVTDVADPTGRPATLLKIETEQQIHEWWFDSDSDQLLAIRDSDAATGQVYSLEVVRAAGVTDSTDDGAALVTSFIPPPVHDPATP